MWKELIWTVGPGRLSSGNYCQRHD